MTTTRIMSGATGFVGSHFLARWLSQGIGVRALVRAASPQAAQARVEHAYTRATGRRPEAGLFADCRATCADLAQPSCGVSAHELAEPRSSGRKEFWHFGASLKYENHHREQIFAANLQGTLHALTLARDAGAEQFVYVSTAYTAGKQSGCIVERLHDASAGFNNCYEESKWRAEHEVAKFCVAHGLQFAILRPSIVIGPYTSKATGGSTTGFYGFIRELRRVERALRAFGRPLAITGDPETPCNLIPIDWFVDDVEQVLESGLENGGVYHHTLDEQPRIGEIGEVVAHELDLPGFAVAGDAPLGPIEALFARRTSFYSSYLDRGKWFERRFPFGRSLSPADLAAYVRAYVSEEASSARASHRDGPNSWSSG